MNAELDRLVADYKHIADNDGEHRISDLVWLINEMIYEREHPAAKEPNPEPVSTPEPMVSAAAIRAEIEARITRFRERAETAARLASDHPSPSASEAHRYANSILIECADELQVDLDRLLASETEPTNSPEPLPRPK